MFRGKALRLFEIARLFEEVIVYGRKIALNFALSNYEIDEQLLAALFNPEMFMCKITPMHETWSVIAHGLQTKEGYVSYKPYQDVERRLKSVGFDVIVFVPSKEEDESRITCGNAILVDSAAAGEPA
jgi:23S rRNA (adenine2503-C2)-methyltransferase